MQPSNHLTIKPSNLKILIIMDIFSTYGFIISASLVIIISFCFGELSRKTNIPSVLMLIVLGIVLKFGLDAMGVGELNIRPVLEVLGTVGLIMIVLEAALELELKPEKYMPIAKAFTVALIGLLLSIWAAAEILDYFFGDRMTTQQAWLYATPLSILSSAIIIPSVTSLTESKKEFHIYESTFSDILGIMVFYFLTGNIDADNHGDGGGFVGFAGTVVLTIILSLIASYIIVLIFQNIKSHTKLFLLIAVLLLLYAIGKKMHLSSLIIILVFGLLMTNMKLFFKGPLSKYLKLEEAEHIYEGLHVITMETAFVIRTFFFVVFGLTISLASLASMEVIGISVLIVASIYLIRVVLLRIFVGSDILPQLFIAPRGLITVLLFYAIPESVQVESFSPGILLFIILATGVIMTIAMIQDKKRTGVSLNKALKTPVGYERWKAPTITEVAEPSKDAHH